MKIIKSAKIVLTLFIVTLGITLTSCKSDKANESKDQTLDTDSETEVKSTDATTTNKLKPNDIIYSWVDKLNIRDTPNLKGKVITNVQIQDALVFSGDKSKEEETIVLRGVAYKDHWLQIKTPDGKTGWVYGGAVKSESETKGNASMNANEIVFPYFGNYNLKDWKKQGTKDESGGDAEIITITYSNGLQELEISDVDVGDYGYGTIHKLYNDKKLVRQRDFNFIADVGYRELVEIVKDYSKNPPVKYMRSQKLDKHPSQLNALPMMANGEWIESKIEDPKEIRKQSNSMLQSFAYNKCNSLDIDSGCACNFWPTDDKERAQIFLTDLETNSTGCLNIEGIMTTVFGKNIDNRQELYENSFNEYWIEHKEKEGTFLFGKKANLNNYKKERDLLVQTLLVMDEIPKDIPINTKGTVGMGTRSEYRSMASEALKMAKEAKEKGDNGPPMKMEFKNKTHIVSVEARIVGLNDGGGEQYEGTIDLKLIDGTILETIEVKGGCGC